MPLNIRDPEVHALARQIADTTGETMTQAVKAALRERLERVRAVDEAERERRRVAIREFVAQFQAAPVIDPRSPEEIWGYDENGLPR